MTGARMGRRPRTVQYSQAREVLMASARDAAHYICGCFLGSGRGFEVSRPSPARLKAAMYCLDQVLGKPVIRLEGFDGAKVTYNQIIIQARERAKELAAGEYPVVMEGQDGDSRTSDVLEASGMQGHEDAETGGREAGMP